MSSYSQLATEVYDIDKPLGHSFGDVEYYRDRLQSCTGRILEPAVGSGRILIPLLEAGYTVDGLDSSPEMLASCRQRCQSKGFQPELYEGEMQDFNLPHQYEAIVIPTGSFLLLHEREDSLKALQCFYNHLQAGGRLIVDLFLDTDFNTEAIKTKTWTNPEGDILTMESKLIEVDFLHQSTLTYLKYEKWRNGQLIQSELQSFPLRWYGLEEFKMILTSIGFTYIQVSADYEYDKIPTSSEQTFTFEAVKP